MCWRDAAPLPSPAGDQVKSPTGAPGNQRADELHDIVSTAARFPRLTVGCAVHDHKFYHPQTITTDQGSSRRAERRRKLRRRTRSEGTELAVRRAQLAEVERSWRNWSAAQAGERTQPLARAGNPRRKRSSALRRSARDSSITNAYSYAENCIDELEVTPRGAASKCRPRQRARKRAPLASIELDIHGSNISTTQACNTELDFNERGKGGSNWSFRVVNISRIIWAAPRAEISDRLALDYASKWPPARTIGGWSRHRRIAFVRAGRKQTAARVSPFNHDQPLCEETRAERADLESRIAELTKAPMIYAAHSRTSGARTRLHRGDANAERKPSTRALSVIPVKFSPPPP